MYGDPECHDLRHALAEHHGIAAENVVVGEGIDGLLGYLVRLTVAPGDAVVTSDGAYPTFNYHVTGFGGVLHRVPYRDDAEDLAALTARAADTRARLIYVANPDNPMGSWHNSAAVAAADRGRPGGHPAHPRRGLCRLRARAGLAPDRPRRHPRHPHAHLQQGLRPRRPPRRLCHWRRCNNLGLRPRPQPLRHGPDRAGRRPRRARRRRLAAPTPSPRPPPPASASPPSPARPA